MKKTKKLCLALICCFSVFAGTKAFAIDNLVFEMKDGSKIIFVLENHPEFTVQGNNLVATDKSGKSQTIALDKIASYEVQENNTLNGIEQPTAGVATKPVYANGHVYYEGLKEATVVRVIAINGQEMEAYKAPANGRVDIDLTKLAKGIYIIQAGKNAIKITNK